MKLIQKQNTLNTRDGGRVTDQQFVKMTGDTCKATHGEHSCSKVDVASHIWFVGDDTAAIGNVMPVVKIADIDASMVLARASQRKEKAGPLSIQKEDKERQIIVDTYCSVIDAQDWLKEVRVRDISNRCSPICHGGLVIRRHYSSRV